MVKVSGLSPAMRLRVAAVLSDRLAELDGERAEVQAVLDAVNAGDDAAEPATVQPSARSLAQRKRWAKRKGVKR